MPHCILLCSLLICSPIGKVTCHAQAQTIDPLQAYVSRYQDCDADSNECNVDRSMVLLAAVVSLFMLFSPSSQNKFSVATLPADLPVDHGQEINKICGRCCQDGSYCGQLAKNFSLYDADTDTHALKVFDQGSNLTCMLRAREVFGAVDGGLCIPSGSADMDTLPSFCTKFAQVVYGQAQTLTSYALCLACAWLATFVPHISLTPFCLADLARLIYAHRRHIPGWSDCSAGLWTLLRRSFHL